MIDPGDMSHCEEAIRHGSLSFHAASRLMPAHHRNPCLALYAFCRLADDAVDLQPEKPAAVLNLQERLELVYRGTPRNTPADRAFAAVVEDVEMPRALPDALLEGLAWDAQERTYETLSDLRAYSARVASAVGVMMAVIMGVRDADALARACDLGVAMQLTNIARDVGEDAKEGRLYLPLDWLAEARLEPAQFLARPLPSDEIRAMVKRLLAEARRLYERSEAGIPKLPVRCRPAIYAARYIYAGIGGDIARAGHDSISRRAHTSLGQKVGWLGLSALRAGASTVMPQSAVLYAPPLAEVRFLVDAASRGETVPSRANVLVGLMADLKARDAAMRMDAGPARPT